MYMRTNMYIFSQAPLPPFVLYTDQVQDIQTTNGFQEREGGNK